MRATVLLAAAILLPATTLGDDGPLTPFGTTRVPKARLGFGSIRFTVNVLNCERKPSP